MKTNEYQFTKEEAERKVGTRVSSLPACPYVDAGKQGAVISASNEVIGVQQGIYRVAVKLEGDAPIWYEKKDYEKFFVEVMLRV